MHSGQRRWLAIRIICGLQSYEHVRLIWMQQHRAYDIPICGITHANSVSTDCSYRFTYCVERAWKRSVDVAKDSDSESLKSSANADTRNCMHLSMYVCVPRCSCIYYSLLFLSLCVSILLFRMYSLVCCISWLHRRVRTEPIQCISCASFPVFVFFSLSHRRIRFWLRHILNFNSVSNLLCCESRTKAIYSAEW